jgi:hypothetical protein
MPDNVGITPGTGAITYDGAQNATAHEFGQDDRVASLDAEIAETEATLATLRTVE